MNPKSFQYELIIIGGGPAGAGASVYAARKQIKTALITKSFGGQSIESEEIQNWIGTIAISGIELSKQLKEHSKFYAGEYVDIKEGERVESVSKIAPTLGSESRLEDVGNDGFEVKTNKNSYTTKTILVATGSSRRKLDIKGAKEFEGRGITYCASCDGPFFADKDVVVIGGGNAGFESALQLLAYCKSVTLLSRSDFKADPVTIEKIQKNQKFVGIKNAIPLEIKGDKMASSIVYKNENSEEKEIKAEGIFVEIGHFPATSFAEGLVEMNEFKNIKIDHKTQRTSASGIWAAGDCTDVFYHQNNIATGDAIKALEDIYIELQKMK